MDPSGRFVYGATFNSFPFAHAIDANSGALRSKIKYLALASNGNASRNGCVIHRLLG